MQLAKVAGAQAGAFSTERIFIHKLSEPPRTVQHKAHAIRHVAAKERLRKRFIKRILPFVALFLALLFQVLVRIQLVHTGYQVHALRKNALSYDNELRELSAKLAVATCPKNLIARAQKELNLTITPPQRIRSF
jgi:hypothetical protein